MLWLILGGLLGFMCSSLLVLSSENLEIKKLRMYSKALEKEVKYWKQQAMELRKRLGA